MAIGPQGEHGRHSYWASFEGPPTKPSGPGASSSKHSQATIVPCEGFWLSMAGLLDSFNLQAKGLNARDTSG